MFSFTVYVIKLVSWGGQISRVEYGDIVVSFVSFVYNAGLQERTVQGYVGFSRNKPNLLELASSWKYHVG